MSVNITQVSYSGRAGGGGGKLVLRQFLGWGVEEISVSSAGDCVIPTTRNASSPPSLTSCAPSLGKGVVTEAEVFLISVAERAQMWKAVE